VTFITFVTNCCYTCDLYYICDWLLHLCLQHPFACMNGTHGRKMGSYTWETEMQNMQNKEKSSLCAHQEPAYRLTKFNPNVLKSLCFGGFCNPRCNKIMIFSWQIFANRCFFSLAKQLCRQVCRFCLRLASKMMDLQANLPASY